MNLMLKEMSRCFHHFLIPTYTNITLLKNAFPLKIPSVRAEGGTTIRYVLHELQFDRSQCGRVCSHVTVTSVTSVTCYNGLVYSEANSLTDGK